MNPAGTFLEAVRYPASRTRAGRSPGGGPAFLPGIRHTSCSRIPLVNKTVAYPGRTLLTCRHGRHGTHQVYRRGMQAEIARGLWPLASGYHEVAARAGRTCGRGGEDHRHPARAAAA